tara:strand:+ start:99824 stop:100270 length:447 start_codon:yes stop_codon:yes gene_type:complete
MFNNIVVGFDGSTPSENALRMACYLANTSAAAIHVAHTPRRDTVGFALGVMADSYIAANLPTPEEITTAADKIFAQAKAVAAEAGVAQVTTHQGNGDPARDILACIAATDAELVVLGRRGLGSLRALVMGSTSSDVTHLATCACLTVA